MVAEPYVTTPLSHLEPLLSWCSTVLSLLWAWIFALASIYLVWLHSAPLATACTHPSLHLWYGVTSCHHCRVSIPRFYVGGDLKFPNLSMIPPAGINCAIACCHNQNSLRGGGYFGNGKVDHCSPSPLGFRYFLSKYFPDAPKTSDKNKTCWCTRNLLSRRRSSVECPLRFNSIIIHLSLFLGCSGGILQTSTVIPNISTLSLISNRSNV